MKNQKSLPKFFMKNLNSKKKAHDKSHLQVPTGTNRCPQVPTGANRYPQVPTDTNRYPQVPTGTNKKKYTFFAFIYQF